MSKKFKIVGPNGEVLGAHYRESESMLMIGGISKHKSFLNHICFNVLKLSKADITKEGERQNHKYRYHFDVNTEQVNTQWYVLTDKYTVLEIDSIIKIT